MVRRAAATAALVLGALAGCGDGDRSGDVRTDPTTSLAPSATPAAPATESAVPDVPQESRAARRDLRQAIARLTGAGTAAYSVSYDIPGLMTSHDEGHFDLTSASWDQTRTMTVPEDEETITFWFRTVGSRSWMRAAGDPHDAADRWACWVSTDDLDASQLGLDAIGGAPAPAAAIAASWSIGSAYMPNGIAGTVDLVAAVQLLSSKSIVQGHLDPDSDATIPAEFVLADGVLTGIDIRIADLFEALVDTGAFPSVDPAELDAFPGLVSVRFSEVGRPVRIVAPPAAEILQTFDEQSFAEDMTACGER